MLLNPALSLGNTPTWHRGLPSWGNQPREAPESPKTRQRVRHGVRKEPKKSPKLCCGTLFGLRGAGALFGDSGALGFRARRARKTSVPGRGVPNPAPSPNSALRSVCALELSLEFKSITLLGIDPPGSFDFGGVQE